MSLFGGGSQGQIRYSVIFDDQATAKINTYKTALTGLGTASTNTQRNMQGFNTSLQQQATSFRTSIAPIQQQGTALTTLNKDVQGYNTTLQQQSAILKNQSSAFNASLNPIKEQGNALINLSKNLQTNGQTAMSLGTKIKNTASQFAGFATGLSATASGVLQLAAGFRDYNDAQIQVDRVTRRVSLAHESLQKAQDKLNGLTAKGITSGKQYQQAQLDVSQAQDQLKIQTQLLGEAQERMFDSQTQFATAIIPTVLGAVGTLGSAFKDLGLNGDKLRGVFSKLGDTIGLTGGGMKGMIGTLGLLAIAVEGARVVWDEYNKTASMVKQISEGTVTPLEGVKKRLDDLTKVDFSSLDAAFATIVKNVGPGVPTADLLRKFLDNTSKGTQQLTKDSKELAAARADLAVKEKAYQNAIRTHQVTDDAAAKRARDLAAAKVKQLEATEKVTIAEQKLDSVNAASANNVLRLKNQFLGLTDTGNVYVKEVVEKLKAKDVELYWKSLANWGNQAWTTMKGLTATMTTYTEVQGNLLKQRTGIPALTTPKTDPFALIEKSASKADTGITQLNDTVKKSTNIFGVWKDTAAPAIETITKIGEASKMSFNDARDLDNAIRDSEVNFRKWIDTMKKAAFDDFASGIDKIKEAFDKFHKKDWLPEIKFDKAQKAFNKFLSEVGERMQDGGDKNAKDYITKFAATATKKMSDSQKKIFQPILDWINAHGSEPPDQFMSEFLQVIGQYKPELAQLFPNLFPKEQQFKTWGGARGTAVGDGIVKGLEKSGKKVKGVVDKMQADIDALHGKTIQIVARAKIEGPAKAVRAIVGHQAEGGLIRSAAAGDIFTTNGPQLVMTGDNPGGNETVAFIPHNNPRPTLESIAKMFGGGGGDIHITVNTTVLDEKIMRKFTARQGRNRYSFG